MKTTKILRTVWLCGGLVCLSLATAQAADVLKADNADDLALGSSWTGAAPTASDVAVWNSKVTSANSTLLGADLSWLGIRIADPGGPVTLNAGNALTLGAAGIDLSAASQDLTLSNDASLGAPQIWSVGASRTLTEAGLVSGAAGNSLTKNGGGTLILGGANTYAGGTMLNAGVLQLNTANGAGTGGITNNGGTVLFGGTLNVVNVFNVSGTTTVDLNNVAGSMLLSGAWSGSGTVNVTNLVSGSTFTAGGNGNGGGNMTGFTGTIALGDSAGTFRFNNGGGNNNVGNADATLDLGTGSAIFFNRNNNANATVNFGALKGGPNTTIRQGASGSGTTIYNLGAKNLATTFAGQIIDGASSSANFVAITKVGTNTLILTGTNTYAGATTISSGTLQIGDGGTSGTLGIGNVVNNASLVFDRSDTVEVVNAISGPGNLIQKGAGTLLFNGTNTSSGATIIQRNTLALGVSGVISSPISVARGAVFDVSGASGFVLGQNLAGAGTVSGSLTAGNNSSLSPAGNGIAGTLTLANGLTESGDVINSFDLSDDPTGKVKTNDLINIVGDLTLNGVNSLVLAPLNGSIPPGTYTLIKYSGNLNGSLANLTVSGASGTLTNPPGAIALIVSSSRPAANLTWKGDNTANTWDENTSPNWLNGANPDKFLSLDRVRFDNSGSANPPVNLTGVLLPASVVVDATKDYTFAGTGKISGGGGLTKTNSGTLTILTANDYTGATIIQGGTLVVSTLANGASASSIGSASSDPTNWVFNGTTLRYTGPTASTDRGATLNAAGATIDVELETENLTLNGLWTGAGGLTKLGAGTLTLVAAETYTGGTVIRNGTVALGANAANSLGTLSGLGPTNSPVTFNGGTLELFGYNGAQGANYSTLYNPLVVPSNQVGTLRMFPRGPSNTSGLASKLTGAGTLNLIINYVRDNLDGDWSGFTGQINVIPKPSGAGDELRINNSLGYAQAAIYLNDGVIMNRVNTTNATIDIGELGGTSLAVVGPGNQSAVNPTWRVGARNTTATFAGAISDDGITSVTKVGTGTWILTGMNPYTGLTTVSDGVLALSGDGSIPASITILVETNGVLDVSGRSDGTLTLNVSQSLAGDGMIRGSVIASMGTAVSPGASNGMIGRLTITNALELQADSLLTIDVDTGSGKNDAVVGLASVTYGGTLSINGTFVGGESLKLFDAKTYSGAFAGIVPETPGPDMQWDTSQLTTSGTLIVSGGTPVPKRPTIQTIGITTGTGSVTLSGSGGTPSGTYRALSATNIILPLVQWTPIATNQFDSTGSFRFTIVVTTNIPQSFFLLQVP
jgi:autotransporter-associated beta strand protein